MMITVDERFFLALVNRYTVLGLTIYDGFYASQVVTAGFLRSRLDSFPDIT